MTFSAECSKHDHDQGVGSPMRVQEHGLIKALFCSVAEMEPLFLKGNICSCCIDCSVKTLSTNLDCIFRKSFAITTLKPISEYKLVEYLVNIHLMLSKKFILQFMFTFWSSSMLFFLAYKLFVVRIAANWKVRVWGTLYNENLRSEEEQKFHFCLNLI